MDSLDATFIRSLFTPDYYRLYQLLEVYTAKVALRIVRQLGVVPSFQHPSKTIDEITRSSHFHPQATHLFEWLLKYLAQMDYIRCNDSQYTLTDNTFDTDTESIRDQLLRLEPSTEIFLDLLSGIENQAPTFFSGKKTGKDILFADPAMASLWNDYFNNRFRGYSLLNYSVAYGLTKWFSLTKGKTILEIGSGTSGATIKVFQMLQDNNLLNQIDTIILTDIADTLLEVGKQNIKHDLAQPPAYQTTLFDINQAGAEQKLFFDRADIIYGVNVLHVARDLQFSLRELHKLLDQDGMLVIAETIRPTQDRAMLHEIIFNLLENYYEVNLVPKSRPLHGFLTIEQWIQNFKEAGFKNIECITELHHYDKFATDLTPHHSFLVIKGQK